MTNYLLCLIAVLLLALVSQLHLVYKHLRFSDYQDQYEHDAYEFWPGIAKLAAVVAILALFVMVGFGFLGSYYGFVANEVAERFSG